MDKTARPALITTSSVLLALIVILIGGGLAVRTRVAQSFGSADKIRAMRALAGEALEQQLNEETGLRGYAATHDTVYLEPYHQGEARLATVLPALQAAAHALAIADAVGFIQAAANTNAQWNNSVARPLIQASGNAMELQRRGKTLVDRYRDDLAAIGTALNRSESAVNAQAQTAIDRVGVFTVAAVVAVLVLAGIFAAQQFRLAARLQQERLRAEQERSRATELRAAYETEKRIADTLQNAFAQRPLPSLPMLRFSATYVPATEETSVGGDWYDALELPANRVLFAIGDVAGHGIEAAVTMSQARQSLISCALLDGDPASVLRRVNAELMRQKARMVTAVTGYADAKTYEFVYSTAGHPPPLLVEPGRAPRLLEFGAVPLAVINDAVYQTYRIQSTPGAMLVLYTDGAVEHSRDVVKGEALLLDAAARAAQSPGTDSATIIHNEIFNGRPVGDDVAILTICFSEEPSTGLTISADNSQAAFVGRLGGTTISVLPVGSAKRRAS